MVQGGGKRRQGIGYAGSEQTMNMLYNEFPKCNVLRQDHRCEVLTV